MVGFGENFAIRLRQYRFRSRDASCFASPGSILIRPQSPQNDPASSFVWVGEIVHPDGA
jgi:hypothetical protein